MEAARDEEAPKPALVQLLVRAAPAEAERQEMLRRRRIYHPLCCSCCERAFARRKCCHELEPGEEGQVQQTRTPNHTSIR